MKTLTEPERNFYHSLVAIQLHYVACSIQNRSATLAAAHVIFDGCAQHRLDIAVEIIRDFAPYLFASDYHGFVPFSNDNRPLHAPLKPGDNRSRSINRARKRRVLTEAVEMPSDFAVSSMLRCCMSRSTKTSR